MVSGGMGCGEEGQELFKAMEILSSFCGGFSNLVKQCNSKGNFYTM